MVESKFMVKTGVRLGRVALGILGLAVVGLHAEKANAQCNIDFNRTEALSALTDGEGGFATGHAYAGQTFAYTPHYRQACGCCTVALVPTTYSHYHLGHENPNIGRFFEDFNGPGQDLNCTCFAPTSIPPNGFGRMDGCPPTRPPTCTGVDHRLEPRRVSPHDQIEILQFSAPTFVGGAPVGATCILRNGTQACLQGEGQPFTPASIDVTSGQVTFTALYLNTQTIIVSTNPPVTVTVPILTAVTFPPVGTGTINLSGMGTVIRLLAATAPPEVGFGIDNFRMDMAAYAALSELQSTEWFRSNGTPLPSTQTTSTQGVKAHVLPAPGFQQVVSAAVDSANMPYVGTKLAFNIFIPTAQSNPNSVGDAQLLVSIPSAGITNKSLGSRGLTQLPRGKWSSLAFDIDAQLRAALFERHPDVKYTIASNLVSSAGQTLIDAVHFEGDLTTTPRCGDGKQDPSEECDDHNLVAGDGCSATCQIEDPGACSEATAIDLGVANSVRTVPSDACLKVTQYPGSWVHAVELQSQSGSGYPIPFSWSNCSAGGEGSFNGNWVQKSLRTVSSSCTTLIQLEGSGTSSITLAWWGNG